MRKPKWEKEMEDYVNSMTEEEVRTFLEDTKYDFYKNVKASFLGLRGLDSLDDYYVDLADLPSSWQQTFWGPEQLEGIIFDTNTIVSQLWDSFNIENIRLDKSPLQVFIPWEPGKDFGKLPTWSITIDELDLNEALEMAASVVAECLDIRRLTDEEDIREYDLAA